MTKDLLRNLTSKLPSFLEFTIFSLSKGSSGLAHWHHCHQGKHICKHVVHKHLGCISRMVASSCSSLCAWYAGSQRAVFHSRTNRRLHRSGCSLSPSPPLHKLTVLYISTFAVAVAASCFQHRAAPDVRNCAWPGKVWDGPLLRVDLSKYLSPCHPMILGQCSTESTKPLGFKLGVLSWVCRSMPIRCKK